MPLALLLGDQAKVWTDGVAAWEPWEGILELESRILERARSIFLVRWFGSDLPLDGPRLRVWIDNLDALRTRVATIFALARGLGGRGEGPEGPNLIEPLAGMAGTLAGSFVAPFNAMTLAVLLPSVSRHWLIVLIAALTWVTFGLFGTALFPLAFLGGGLYELLTLSSGRLGLLAALARLAAPLTRFWEQVTGPRERVRNPLLRAVLELGDRLAALVPQLIGAFAVLVTDVGALLRPLAAELAALGPLILELLSEAHDIWDDLHTRFKEGLTGRATPWTVAEAVFERLSAALQSMGEFMLGVWGDLVAMATLRAEIASDVLDRWRTDAMPVIESYTTAHPAIASMREFGRRIDLVSGIWRANAPPPTPPSPPGLVPRFPTLPPFPAAPQLPGTSVVTTPLVPWETIPAVGHVLDSIDDLLSALWPPPHHAGPPSVFLARRARLDAARPEAARVRERLDRAELEAYLGLAERLVPEKASGYVVRLEEVLADVESTLSGRPARELPVLLPGESRVLRPEVGTLRVRMAGGSRADGETWVATLRRALTARPALVPAGF